jgi:predicted NBD/HSP70 family sugar kinase
VRRAGRLLGEGLGSVANLLDLELVAVGGSVAWASASVLRGGQRGAARHQPPRLHRRLPNRARRPRQGRPLIGAGALGWRLLGEDVGVR